MDTEATGSPHDPLEYASHVAADYDEMYEGIFDTAGAVELIIELAGGGAVMELGVGTGRLAIELAAAGITAVGVDAAPAMLAALMAKPGGDRVRTVLADFRTVEVPDRFAVVAIVFNTIFGLPDQADQVAVFANATRHLADGGRFVVEAFVPESPRGSVPTIRPRKLAAGRVGLVISEDDRARQVLTTTQVVLGGPPGLRIFPLVHRYAHPAELDLMAQLAGLELEHRWADWRRSPFTSMSEDHVSVYRRT
jgi:SAM-dependent methyltransferase